ncbi:membrane hypothetical protein [Pseudomonas sp. 8AS]|uniref:hypothetical protein n=1 Tax=Pseudomonas sp. 8AS TaxID=2653163 RepID=UPI0012F37D38|nr:hypothetical protein [Pseudomonas sp. 8AS]VXC34195.1 membrane hypothetical protein [Pseudomonas sp. 8AS]
MYRFKTDAFDSRKLGAIIADLQCHGLEVEPRWADNNQPCAPGQANKLLLFIDSREFFCQEDKRVRVDPQSFTEEQQAFIIQTLATHGLIQPPDYSAGAICLIFYALIQVLVLSRLLEMGTAWLLGIELCNVLLLAGHALYFSLRKADSEIPAWLPLWLMLPALILLAPASLLNLPLLNAHQRARAYARVPQPALLPTGA